MCSKWSEYGRILQEKGLVTQFAFYSKGGHLWATTSSHFQVEPEEFSYLTAGFQVQPNEGLSFRECVCVFACFLQHPLIIFGFNFTCCINPFEKERKKKG